MIQTQQTDFQRKLDLFLTQKAREDFINGVIGSNQVSDPRDFMFLSHYFEQRGDDYYAANFAKKAGDVQRDTGIRARQSTEAEKKGRYNNAVEFALMAGDFQRAQELYPLALGLLEKERCFGYYYTSYDMHGIIGLASLMNNQKKADNYRLVSGLVTPRDGWGYSSVASELRARNITVDDIVGDLQTQELKDAIILGATANNLTDKPEHFRQASGIYETRKEYEKAADLAQKAGDLHIARGLYTKALWKKRGGIFRRLGFNRYFYKETRLEIKIADVSRKLGEVETANNIYCKESRKAQREKQYFDSVDYALRAGDISRARQLYPTALQNYEEQGVYGRAAELAGLMNDTQRQEVYEDMRGLEYNKKVSGLGILKLEYLNSPYKIEKLSINSINKIFK